MTKYLSSISGSLFSMWPSRPPQQSPGLFQSVNTGWKATPRSLGEFQRPRDLVQSFTLLFSTEAQKDKGTWPKSHG